MTGSITQSAKMESKIPNWMIWVQCTAFVVLYAVWILPEIVGFRNTALVVGALFGVYSIYQYRDSFLQKAAIPIWLIIALFIWATFHLFFLSSNFSLQYVEYFRIWKYVGLAAIMASGLGLSLAQSQSTVYWHVIYFGLCTPVIIYLIKYVLTVYGVPYGLDIPSSLGIYEISHTFYVPKTDYVAFCIPAFSVALGLLKHLSDTQDRWNVKNYLSLITQTLVIGATLFLFAAQNIKNGIAYATVLSLIFICIFFFDQISKITLKKILGILILIGILISAVNFNVKSNDSWKTLIADIKVGLQIDRYDHWKYADEKGFPLNEYGVQVSHTNYDRVAWAHAGLRLSFIYPFGYGLIEDSFGKMAIAQWPEASPNLSHSHSGWLDVILAIGYPGFLLIFIPLAILLRQFKQYVASWSCIIFGPLLGNLLLWFTTEVAATVTFAALIFWISFAGGVNILRRSDFRASN